MHQLDMSFKDYKKELLNQKNVREAIQARENYYKLQTFTQKFDFWRQESMSKFQL